MKALLAVTKRLLASNKISFILTAVVVLCATSSGDVILSNGNYTWLLAVLTPFFFVFYDFTKLMHLGASKKDYFFGCLISLQIASQNGHLCHIRRPLCDLNGGQPGTH